MRPFWRTGATGGEPGSRGPHPDETRPLARRFTYRYALALTILSLLALWTLWTITESLQEIDQANRELVATTEQQARVNQIAELASALATSANNGNGASTADLALLRDQIQELEVVQRGLLEGSGALDLPGNPSAEIKALYFGPDTRLADELTSYTALADRLPGLLEAEADASPRDDIVVQLRRAADPVNGRVGVGLEQAVDVYADKISTAIDNQRRANQGLLLLWVIALLVVVFVIMRPMANSIQIETTNLRDAERNHRENNERQTFHNQLNQALEGTENEEEVLEAVSRAMSGIIAEEKGELLLVDQSGAHLRQAQVNKVGGPNCPVDSPQACAAIRRGQTVAYETSRALNVCPKLTQHEGGACSAVCSPVMFLGRAIGVLHATGPDLTPPHPTRVERLNVLARETGNRLGTMRASAQTELQASTDGLTGLPNRRSLEQTAADLVTVGRPFTIAMADLDHFKELNDSQGHEAGDRALKLFARTIRQNLRPDDVAARYGGEEFVLLLPNTTIEEARRALDRLRITLAGEIAAAGSARFTASWGLTTSASGSSFDEMIVAADEALYAAKRAGRNRVEVGGSPGSLTTRIDDTADRVTAWEGVAETSPFEQPHDHHPLPADDIDEIQERFDQAAAYLAGSSLEPDLDRSGSGIFDEGAGPCPDCGKMSPYDSRFCLECGRALERAHD